MKEIKAFCCEFCGKILQTRSGMWKHEKNCFYNPKRKACIICPGLTLDEFIGNKALTESEITQLEINGKVGEIETDNYCSIEGRRLRKLTFNCPSFTNKPD